MTVFKTFLKILNKNKFIVILYTTILLFFGVSNFQNNENSINFEAVKPNIIIVNEDKEEGITKNFIEYLENNSNIIIPKDETEISDSLFYRQVNYVIYIPKNYSNDFMNGSNPEIKIKSSGDYLSSFSEILVNRYLNVANTYQKVYKNEEELINKINDTLKEETNIKITSKLDTNGLSKAAYYFNFESYSILACLIYIICLILSIFNEDKIRKRVIISSMNYKKNNRILLLSNLLYAFIIWLFYLIISFILIGNVLFSMHGLLFIINSFIFTLSSTSLAFLLGNLIRNKNAISGVVNVVALGSSFLCGAFVPLEYLPSSVLNISKFLPTYYFVKSNELIKVLEDINFETLKPILTNMIILLIYMFIFIILSNIISKIKRKLD